MYHIVFLEVGECSSENGILQIGYFVEDNCGATIEFTFSLSLLFNCYMLFAVEIRRKRNVSHLRNDFKNDLFSSLKQKY